MTIKVGDYVESLHGMVGVVKTVWSTLTVDEKDHFTFEWEITRPSIRSGDRGFFAGSESDLWLHYRQIGMYHNPFQKERMTKQRIEPIECGEFDILKRTKLTVTDLAVKINEIVNYLNAEEC